MKFSILDDAPACPPGPRRSNTTVETPSEAAYTAAAIPAGPAPTITRSTASVGQSRHTPAVSATSRSDGLIKRRPFPNSMTGERVGEPQLVMSRCPSSETESCQMNGTKFLKRNSRTSIVSRHFPGPTTFNPTAPVSSKRRRRSTAAPSKISPKCGTLFNSSRIRTPSMRMSCVLPRATPVTRGGRRVNRSMSPEN